MLQKAAASLWHCAFIIIVLLFHQTQSELEKQEARGVRINKCCEPFEILIDSRCTHVNDSTTGEKGYPWIFMIIDRA